MKLEVSFEYEFVVTSTTVYLVEGDFARIKLEVSSEYENNTLVLICLSIHCVWVLTTR